MEPKYIRDDKQFAKAYSKRLGDHIPGVEKHIPIVIFGSVEDTDDAKFWRSIFNDSEEEKHLKLRIRCDEKIQGKQKLIDMIKNNEVDLYNIVFIDSDFNYILQWPIINNNPYVFQTYTHSIENHYYQSENLYNYCCEVSEFHDDTVSFDFENFLKEYSNIIYKLFVCMICNCKNNDNECINESPLLHKGTYLPKMFYLVDIINEIIEENKEKLKKIKSVGELQSAKEFMYELDKIIISKLQNKTQDIRLCDNCDQKKRENIQKELESLGIYPDAIYLHIDGHILEKNVIKPIINLLIHNVLRPIKDKSIKREERNDKFHKHLKKYAPHYDIKPNVSFAKSIWSEKIIGDFERFFSDPDNCREWFRK